LLIKKENKTTNTRWAHETLFKFQPVILENWDQLIIFKDIFNLKY